MKIFNEPNLAYDWKCPICGKSDVKPVTLIPVLGTEKDGNIQANQYHVDCIDLVETEDFGFLWVTMKFKDRREE